jgi:hypothetical protein
LPDSWQLPAKYLGIVKASPSVIPDSLSNIQLDIFQQLTANGVKAPVYTYVRKNTNGNSPVTDLTSTDMRCNVGGLTGGSTTTVSTAAGSSLTFTLDTAVYHQGPVSIYMAKAPTTAAAYDGSGASWFKIFDLGPTFPGGTWNLKCKLSTLSY